MRATLGRLALLALLTSCDPSSVGVVIELPSGAVADPASYELVVREAERCGTLAEPVGEERIRHAWTEAEDAPAIGRVATDRYTVSVTVRDAGCAVIGFGCAEVDGGPDEVRVAVEAASGGCDATERCVAGACEPGTAGDAGAMDAGPDEDAGPGEDAGPDDAGGVDAGPECVDDVDCGPAGIGRCVMGECARCDPVRLTPSAFHSPGGIGTVLAVETFVPAAATEPALMVAYSELSATPRVVVKTRFVSLYDELVMRTPEPGFETLLGMSVFRPASCTAREIGDDVVVGCIAEVGTEPQTQIVVGELFAGPGWEASYQPTDYPAGPVFSNRDPAGAEVRVGWRGAFDSPGGAPLYSLPVETTPTPAMRSGALGAAPDVTISGTDGPWAVIGDPELLYFWRGDLGFAPNEVRRTLGGGDPSMTLESAGTYLLAYPNGSEVWLRRLTCEDTCAFTAGDPADGVVPAEAAVSRAVVEAIPGGGAVIIYVAGDEVRGRIVGADLTPAGPSVLLASEGSDRRVIALEGDVIDFDGNVHALFGMISRPVDEGLDPDRGVLFGVRFSRTCSP